MGIKYIISKKFSLTQNEFKRYCVTQRLLRDILVKL